LMMFWFAEEAISDLRRFLLRLEDFFVRMCCLYACPRLTLPVPVRLKRFLDALCVLIFNFFAIVCCPSL